MLKKVFNWSEVHLYEVTSYKIHTLNELLFFSGFSSLSLNDQMGLLRGSWSEVFTLSILFRSLPTTVAAAGLAAKEVSNGVKRKLKFAPDYAMTQTIANQCGLQAFYEQVHSYILYIYNLVCLSIPKG